ncbi:hypothetical protein BDR04DRAFT_505791 [Suillus decipiens]|nr:hypothetical protein BDR04DRAFT_505791 [Suillus decipiens]
MRSRPPTSLRHMVHRPSSTTVKCDCDRFLDFANAQYYTDIEFATPPQSFKVILDSAYGNFFNHTEDSSNL